MLASVRGEGDSLEDCSGTGNDGTINGATWVYSPGQGWVLDYDGSDYVEVPDDPSLEPNTLTVSAWVNLDSLVDWENFVSKWGSGGNQYNLQLDGVDNSITFVVQNAAGTSYRADSGVVPSTGEWYHAVGTWNGTDVSICVNGTLEASVSLSGDLNSGTESVYFGAEDGAATIRLDGTTGGVLIYARALSDGEIANIYEKQNRSTSDKWGALT